MVVQKAVKMTQLMHIPVAGVIENYSYFACPDCGKQVRIFGDSHIDDVAKSFQLPVLAKCPIDPEIARLCDMGLMELVENEYLAAAADAVEAVPPKREA